MMRDFLWGCLEIGLFWVLVAVGIAVAALAMEL